jgi:hypothetical protein
MGRIPYLQLVAWVCCTMCLHPLLERAVLTDLSFYQGRSFWAPPDQSDWDVGAQTNIRRIPPTPEPIDTQYPEDALQYDENLLAVNPVSQATAKAARRAQNDILSVIGVVERASRFDPIEEYEKDMLEVNYIPPLFFITHAVKVLVTQWITNASKRIMV